MTATAPDSASMRKRHVFMLEVAGFVVVSAMLLRVPSQERVELACWPGVRLPEMCLSHSLFKVDCPACGLTRSLVSLAHGDVAGSWHFHRLGWLMMAAVLIQFPYRITALARKQDYPLGKTLPRLFGLALIVLLLGNWLLRLLV